MILQDPDRIPGRKSRMSNAGENLYNVKFTGFMSFGNPPIISV